MMQIIFLLFVFGFGWQSHAATVTGILKSTTDDYPTALGGPTETVIPYLSLDFSGKHKFTKAWRTQWHLSGLTNLESKEALEKLYGDLREGFVEYKKSEFKFRAGMNTINWGVADAPKQADVLNPPGRFNPARSMKRGSAM